MKKSKANTNIKSFDKLKLSDAATKKIKGGTDNKDEFIGIEDVVGG